MIDKIVKKILDQKVIGYSQDYKKIHIQHQMVFNDDSIGFVYSTDIHQDNGTVIIGQLSEIRPYIDIPI